MCKECVCCHHHHHHHQPTDLPTVLLAGGACIVDRKYSCMSGDLALALMRSRSPMGCLRGAPPIRGRAAVEVRRVRSRGMSSPPPTTSSIAMENVL